MNTVIAPSAVRAPLYAGTARPYKRIGVFRALQLGDMLCAVPAFRALRAAFPDARITLIGLPWASQFAQRFNACIDDFLAFPGGQGLPERHPTEMEEKEFRRQLRTRQFDLVIQLHGSGRQSNGIVTSFGATASAGFHEPGEVCPDPERYVSYPVEEPETIRLLRLAQHLGAPTADASLEFPILAHEWQAAARLRASFGLSLGHYACVHPGARAESRRWNPEYFARIADRLAGRGLQIVLSGTAEEKAITHAVARRMLAPCIDLTGEAPIGVAAALFTGARLLVCNDTGVSHVAAALNVPSVVIFLDSSPERWAPLDARRHRRVVRRGDGDGGVGVEEVWREVVEVTSSA